MNAPLVSIIIPAHNARLWVADAIESALEQTHPRCEVIFVDDGSTDGTAEVVRGRYPSIRCIQQNRAGVARARNEGLAVARGEYVQFLDADDVVLPEKVSLQVSFLESDPGWALAYSDCSVFHDDDPSNVLPWDRRDRYASGYLLERLIESGFFPTHAALVRTEWARRMRGFDESLPSNEDWDFFLRLAAAGARFAYHPDQPLALYRRSRGSRSDRRPEHSLAGMLVLSKLADAIDDRGLQRTILRAAANWRFAYGRALAENGSSWRGRREMLLGLLRDRRGWKYKLGVMTLGPRSALLARPR